MYLRGAKARYGAPWRYMALHGAIWRSMVLYGAPWRYMALRGALWRCKAQHDDANKIQIGLGIFQLWAKCALTHKITYLLLYYLLKYIITNIKELTLMVIIRKKVS